jgi:prevent-host-death family protein
MERIGVRELRQNASVWLRRVAEGESFEVTDRGRPVARLVPVRPQGVQALIDAGLATPARGHISELDPPLPREPGTPLLSEILEQLRADER